MSLQSKIAVFLLSFAAFSANATVYNVSELFTQTPSAPSVPLELDYKFTSLFSGDPSLFSTSMTSFIPSPTSSPIDIASWCVPSCTFTEQLKNINDSIKGTFIFTGEFTLPNTPSSSFLFGNTTITGGTGLFEGATGSGFFSSFSDGNNPTTLASFFSVTTVTPVPEPENYAMIMAGLGVMGFVARRRNYKQI